MGHDSHIKYDKESFLNYLNDHYLYRGVPKLLWSEWDDKSEVEPTFFMLNEAIEGLSVDWSKYSTPNDTLKRRNESRSLKEDDLTYYGIIQINIGDFRKVKKEFDLPLNVEHDPELINRAHSLIHRIIRANVSKIRMILSEIANWALEMEPSVIDD